MHRSALKFVTLVVCVSAATTDRRRPFYIIAHMVNSIPEIEYYLDRGANAIEIDVNFARGGSATTTYHGIPCDCLRKCMLRSVFTDYLRHVRNLTTEMDRTIALLMLDLKLNDVVVTKHTLRHAGIDVFNKLVRNLWNDVDEARRVNVLVSIPRVSDRSFFEGFLGELRKEENYKFQKNVGYDVGMDTHLHDVAAMYDVLGIKGSVWQGDGITNCFSGLRPLHRLRKVIELRDQLDGFVHKSYYWTIDLTHLMESVLQLGIDAMITNHPERAKKLINISYSPWYRMATQADSPWEKIINVNPN